MGRIRISLFNWLIMAAVVVAFLWPAQGEAAIWMGKLTTAGVALLFFVHGAALPREAVVAGLTQWRLHLFIFSITFVLFPLLVLPLAPLGRAWLPADLVLGFLYLAALPSAVSSSIAFTAIARGNVPAAVCSAAGSNVFGMMLTPLLLSLMVGSAAEGGFSLLDALRDIVFIMLLPFALGQAIRPWVANWLDRNKLFSERVDQVVLLLIIYTAFAQSVTDGLWQDVPSAVLVLAVVLCLLLLVLLLALTGWLSRRLGFPIEDEIAAVFCGSKKSLASGLPMAKVIFAGHPGFGLIVLPIIIYNQVQIIVGALLAQRYAERSATGAQLQPSARES